MNSISTRRTFLKASALVAAPIAAPAVAMAAASGGDDIAGADEAAIRALHDAWLRGIDGGDGALGRDVRGITPNRRADADVIEIAADGTRATGRFHCLVEMGTELPRDCTLGQMAHAQGSGFVCQTEARMVTVDYAKGGDGWAVKKAVLS